MKISIITVNYNNIEGLKKTVNSVLNQTYKDVEYIVIDGGSNDGTRDFLSDQNEAITYWVSETDNGIYNAMNKGIEVATGDYLLFLNSGDWLIEAKTLEDLAKTSFKADFVYGDVFLETPRGLKLNKYPDQLSTLFLGTSALCHQALFIKKQVFEEHGKYREDLKIAADWEQYTRLYALGKATFQYLNAPVAVYDLSGVSSGMEHKKLFRRERSKVLREIYPEEIVALIEEAKEMKSELEMKIRDLNLQLLSRPVRIVIKMRNTVKKLFTTKR